MRKILSIAFIFCYTLAIAQSKSIDISAIDQVWKIFDQLSQDIRPSDETWKTLFETRGYKALGEWNCNNAREKMELVWLPSKKEALAKALQSKNYWYKRDIAHLISVKENLEKLKTYQQKLNVERILTLALKEAEVYLTKGITKKFPPPPIQFVIFSPDARAMGGNIIFDLKFTMDLSEDDFIKIMAHEAHHHYSNFKKKQFNWPDEESSYDPILNTLRQLKTEGIADLINQPYPLVIKNNDTAFFTIQVNAQKAHGQKMKTLDSMLCKMSDDTTGMTLMGRKAFEMFPAGCHPNGHYMAVLIKKHLGIPALIKSTYNPFLFFRQYRTACQKEKTEYILSDKAMQFINRMEKMFSIKK